jgi:HEAT repeat protein
MTSKLILAILMVAAASHAVVEEIVPRLSADDLAVRTQADLDLLAACSNAGRPGAEEERKAISLEICQILQGGVPMSAMQPLIRNLERIGGEEAIPVLEKLLNHQDEQVRDDARRALSLNPSPAAGQVLGAQLKMRKARTPRESAGLIQALGERREAGASNLIAVQLSSRDEEVFIATVKALGLLGEDDGIRALAAQRAKEKGFRLAQINDALFFTDRKAVFEKLYAPGEPDDIRATALLGLLVNGELNAAPEAMGSGNPALQTAVIEAASQSQEPKLYSLVAASLATLSPALQVQAMGVLEFSGTRTYARVVEPLVASSEGKVPDAAAQALARIGMASSVQPLLVSGSREARRALGMLDGQGVDAMLEKEAAKGGDDARRAVAIEALAMRGRRDLMPQFLAFAKEDGKAVSSAGVDAAGLIGDVSNLEALTQLMIEKETSPLSRDILGAIVKITRRSSEPGKAVAVLSGRLDGASPRSQSNILQALVQTGSSEALAPVAAACKSKDEALQKQAVKLLSGWDDKNALPTLIELGSDESLSLANHVTLMRGVSRLLAGQKKPDQNMGALALEACRRPEERQMIEDVLGAPQEKKKKKK